MNILSEEKVMPCYYCLQQHQAQTPCAALCLFCKALHMKSDLVEGQCPRMNAFAQPQASQTIPCQYCSTGQEQCRSMVNQMMKDLGVEEKEDSQSVFIVECAQCHGTKQLSLLVDCCGGGCYQCGYLKVRANPAVKRAHMLPRASTVDHECAICLQAISKGDLIFRMQCLHEFHYLCLGEWLQTKSRCPCCRHTDMFLQVDLSFQQQLREVRGELGQPEPVLRVHINADGEIVQGDGWNSDWSEASEDMYYQDEGYDDSIYE